MVANKQVIKQWTNNFCVVRNGNDVRVKTAVCSTGLPWLMQMLNVIPKSNTFTFILNKTQRCMQISHFKKTGNSERFYKYRFLKLGYMSECTTFVCCHQLSFTKCVIYDIWKLFQLRAVSSFFAQKDAVKSYIISMKTLIATNFLPFNYLVLFIEHTTCDISWRH